MRKKTVVFAISFLVMTVIYAVLGMFIIRGAYANEIHTVQNLAGAVITQYPETENVFAEALGDMERKSADAGAAMLIHYGYDEHEKIRENPSYVYVIISFFGILTAFYLLTCLYVYLCFNQADRRKTEQEERILSILEDCFSENYHFIEDEKLLHELQNPLFSDVLVKIGKKLRLKTERIEEEHDMIKALVTDISHQLKTPISALKACFFMCMEAEEEAEKEEFSERCRMQIDKMEIFMDTLINISRLETQMITLCPEKESIANILTDSVNAVYMKALEKQITIESFFEEEGALWVYADRKWTVEAIANILDNAVKYSPSGSGIQIRIQALYNYVRIEIEDNGIGIPQNEWNHIFRRFYRGSNDIVRKTEGAGVGLYLSRKILEDEGGSVFVREAKEQGSVFVVQLPVFH